VALFARELGMVRAIAKGSRRADTRFSGGLEVTSRGEMVAILKPSERATDALATLTAWDLQETFPTVRRSLAAFHSAMYMMDLIHHSVRDSDPHPELYDAALTGLRSLGSAGADAIADAVLRLQWATLEFTGYRPDLSGTSREGAGAAFLEFSPSLGTIVRPGGTRSMDAGVVWRVRPQTIGLLRRLGESGAGTPTRATGDTLERANRFLASYLRVVLGSWPASVASLFPGIDRSEP